MRDFNHDGYTYTVYIRPWKKKGRYEYVRYLIGMRKLWERITKQEYDTAIKDANISTIR